MGDKDGRQDFDFLFGAWRIANRKRVNMVVPGDDEWVEFEATSEARPIVGGLGNIDTYSAPEFPGRPGFEAFTLRLFEPKTALWRIWWASAANPGALDEPVVGRFDDGHGTFECDDVVGGQPVRVRYSWIANAAEPRFEQAFSRDGGDTWATNWITTQRRRDEAAS